MAAKNQKYILLAEDNVADVFLIREALERQHLDCQLHVTSDGAEAIAFVEDLDRDGERPCPELILLDLHLPKYDGHYILNRLRTSGRCVNTQVVLLSSSDSPLDRSKGNALGALQYFRKPSSYQQFMKLGEVVKLALQRTGTGDVDERKHD
jgi:CheY-like chemotaxis protein